MLAAATKKAAPAVSRLPARFISVQSLLHGSPEAKKDGDLEVQQHSRLVGRGKYVHGFTTHQVKPEKTIEYKKAAERFFTGIKDDPELHVKLTGNWETVVGPLDTFHHIVEYENYDGYDKTMALIKKSKHAEAYEAMSPFMVSRNTQLCSEFRFLPTQPPHAEGGVFELRTYQLKPGVLLEWENAWRRGIEARRQFVAPVGAWFSQVGRLHQVHHLWQYPNLDTRKEMRETAWQIDGWADTVQKTAELAKEMDSFILEPLPFSPLQ
ncbi:NIPSNAP-domain-containing protein [Pterulicium gracile]|uniref:NIPSNAP-domain-containing protein n=1 Tax=Pterulicium gracile TaxID=1884261 RepID=A0A5C3QNX3_9AGAR|nr:NIPSNAP-domain-containing protein [Pterula gracilis]